MLMRHRLDFVTPERKVRLQTSALIDAGVNFETLILIIFVMMLLTVLNSQRIKNY